MFDRLCGGKQARIEGRLTFEFLHHLLAFFDDAEDRIAGLAARRFIHLRENLLKPRDVLLSFAFMLLERSAKLVGLRGLCHFRQRGHNFLLGEINVLHCVVESSRRFLSVISRSLYLQSLASVVFAYAPFALAEKVEGARSAKGIIGTSAASLLRERKRIAMVLGLSG